MKKRLLVLALIISVGLSITSCDQRVLTGSKQLNPDFLNMPVETAYRSGCDLDLCFCEYAKQNNSYQAFK